MKTYVQHLDDNGEVTEEVEAHVCVGDPDCCQFPAYCEEDGIVAGPETPIFVWVAGADRDGGLMFACCRNHAESDGTRLVTR